MEMKIALPEFVVKLIVTENEKNAKKIKTSV
jgi:hypothetical protein